MSEWMVMIKIGTTTSVTYGTQEACERLAAVATARKDIVEMLEPSNRKTPTVRAMGSLRSSEEA